MELNEYDKKRDFEKTPEPKSSKRVSGKQLHFVIQRHDASRLHYDFRLELNGVLKSWAVPKGPSLNPEDKRLAVEVEDHPFEYRTFKGIIPEGNYGAGVVEIFDEGTYMPLENNSGLSNEKILQEGLKKGDLKFVLKGENISGAFALVRMKTGEEKNWLLIKKKDDFSITKQFDIEKIKPLKPVTKTVKALFENRKKEKTDKKNATKSTSKKTLAKSISKSASTSNKKVNKKIFDTNVKKLANPMLAVLVDSVVDDANWIYENKYDGYRTMAAIYYGDAQLLSRNKLSLNRKFHEIVKQLSDVEECVILDGEVVAENEKGNVEFQLLQRFSHLPKGKLTYYCFDIIYLNGSSLLSVELDERKILLELFFNKYSFKQIKIAPFILQKGNDLFNKAKKDEGEGIIAKDRNSLYTPGTRTSSWKKIKTHKRQEFIICGFTEPTGSRSKFGSLILGLYEKNTLKFVGHCGSGFTEESLANMYYNMKPLIQSTSPFAYLILTNGKTTWLTPQLICEVKFAMFTNSGILRNAVFMGLRNDKDAKNTTMEKPKKNAVRSTYSPVKKPKSEKSKPDKKNNTKTSTNEITEEKNSNTTAIKVPGGTVKVSNTNKLYWPKEKYSKGQLLEYYKNVAGYMLPYLKDRAHSLNRFPNGITGAGFYQKDVEPTNLPAFVKTVPLHSDSGNKNIDYILCQNQASLLYMANLGCIEINPWNSRFTHIENPDWMVIDLDPGDISFKEVVKTALVTKQVFDKLEVDCYCKTSGATGLHIYVPAQTKYNYDQIRTFSELVANFIHLELPETTSVVRNPLKRKNQIYIDFLQNRRGQTLAAPYCVRPRPGAPVSTPLFWKEVNSDLNQNHFTMFNIMDRISKVGDLWKPVLGKGLNLLKSVKLLEKL